MQSCLRQGIPKTLITVPLEEHAMRWFILACAMVTAQWAFAAEGDESDARKELVGIWKGRVDEGATGHVLTFTTTAITGTKDGKQKLGTGTFKLDLTADPPRMDATGTKGSQKGRKYLGIYSLKGDTLKWCVSMPGIDPPKEFATKEGQFLLILKRQKEKEK
jgi:uncharacterized protein (TIGR03067 family)